MRTAMKITKKKCQELTNQKQTDKSITPRKNGITPFQNASQH